MLALLCMFCGNGPAWTGPLCIEPVPSAPTDTRLICRACALQSKAVAEDLKAVQEDYDDWAEHVRACQYCYQNRGLMPRGALFQTCIERRRVREALAKEEVTV